MPLELSSHLRERPSRLTDSMQSCRKWDSSELMLQSHDGRQEKSSVSSEKADLIFIWGLNGMDGLHEALDVGHLEAALVRCIVPRHCTLV